MSSNTSDNVTNIDWDFLLGEVTVQYLFHLLILILSEGILLPCLALPGIVGKLNLIVLLMEETDSIDEKILISS